MFYSCDICTLTYALRQDHAASRQMWTSALQVLVSRLSPLSGMQGECCSFHVLRPLARRKLLVSPLPLFSPQRNSDGGMSRRTTRRDRRSTRGRTATRCRGTSTPCASQRPGDTFRDLVAGREEVGCKGPPSRKGSSPPMPPLELEVVQEERPRRACTQDDGKKKKKE